MGRGNYSPAIQLRKVLNTAIFKAISLSPEEREKWITLNKSTDPKRAAPEILRALKLNITSEDRSLVFKALLNVKEQVVPESA